jgi:putative ABC transport system permease protein
VKFSDYIKIAFSALKGNRLRSILTLLIISFGIMALIIIFTCIDAIRGNITENFIELGAGAFTVQKEEGLRRRSAANAELKLITFAEAESFAKKFDFPATLSLNTTVDNNITIKTKFKESNPNVSIEAGDIAYIDVSGKNITAGRNFTEMEILNGSNVTVIGYDAAGKVYPAADSVVGSKILIDGKKYSVVGLLESKGASAGKNDNFVLIPYTNARKDFDLSSTSFNVIVEAANPDNLEKAIAEAEGVMRNVKKLGALDENNFSITRSDKLANTYLEQISFIEVATGVIGFLTLLGAGVGLMNIMLVSVNERTREIGLSKSLGATSRTIFMQFLLEAITICVFGGIVGVVLGLILGNLIAIFVLESKFTLAIAWVIGGILFCTMIGLPAYRASKLNPVDALRYE